MLWPYLLECVVPPQYTEAMGSLCRSAAYLANKKRAANADDYELDYEILGTNKQTNKQTFACLLMFFYVRLVNVPKPAEMISRLLVGGAKNIGIFFFEKTVFRSWLVGLTEAEVAVCTS